MSLGFFNMAGTNWVNLSLINTHNDRITKFIEKIREKAFGSPCNEHEENFHGLETQ